MRNKFRLLVLFIAIVPMSALTAVACGCVGTYEGLQPCQAYWNAGVVFTGLVTEIGPPVQVDPHNPNAGFTDNGRVVRFTIDGAYRGVTGRTVELTMAGTSCDYNFKQGESYFVYAGRNPADNRIYSSSCGRTRPLSQAAEDLAYVQSLTKGDPNPSLFGAVLRQVRKSAADYWQTQGIEGVKVIIDGGPKQIETLTDSNGRFQVFGLANGYYNVRAELPEGLQLIFGTPVAQVLVAAPKCSGVAFVATSLGSISGTLTDSEGNPLAETKINLVPINDDDKEVTPAEQSIETYTDKLGQYKFNLLAPGRYLIAVNPKGQPGQFDPPYPRTYYPRASNSAKAEVVTVVEGQETAAGEFRMPSKLAKRMIHGIVTWPDGRPAKGAYIMLVYTERLWMESRGGTDAGGRFSLEAFDGYRYVVHADYEGDGKRLHAPPVEVLVKEENEQLKMAITEPGRSNYFPGRTQDKPR